MSQLHESFSRTIHGRQLLKPGQKVLVAVSGGLDSMVLLHLLHDLARDLRLDLIVAHLNHRLRGRSSDADEKLVIHSAHKLNLPVLNDSIDVKKLARRYKISIEMAARVARHEFLAGVASALGIQSVVLAHHADDQLELFFLRLLRGSGYESLAGMRWRGPSPADPAIELVRPLLDQPKAVLRQYASRKRIRFREDASNASLGFKRNRIRHELLPLLRRRYQPALSEVIARIMKVADAEADFVRQAAVKLLASKKGIAFDRIPVAVQRRFIQLQLIEQGVPVHFDLVENLRLNPARPFMASADRQVVRKYAGRLLLRKTPVASREGFQKSKKSEIVRLDLHAREKKGLFSKLQIHWRFDAKKTSGPFKAFPGREVFDGDRVGRKIVLRHWRPGDRFQPIGMASASKLQDLFTNQKIPRDERHQLVVATTADGTLFWVEKLRISGQFAVSDKTIRRLHWRWKRP